MAPADLASTYKGKTADDWLCEILHGKLVITADVYPNAVLVASRLIVEMNYRYVTNVSTIT